MDAIDRLPIIGISNAVLVADITLDLGLATFIGNYGEIVVLVNDGTGELTYAMA